MHQQGTAVCEAKYKSALSKWKFDRVADIDAVEASVAATWDTLLPLEADKQAALQDALERARFRDQSLLMASQHRTKAEVHIRAWVAEKEAYLTAAEQANTVAEAKDHLNGAACCRRLIMCRLSGGSVGFHGRPPLIRASPGCVCSV